MECIVDPDCRTDQICHNNQCIDPCLVANPCAVNAICQARNHQADCRCPPGLVGDPFVRCERVECNVNPDCPDDKGCVANKCVDPCLTAQADVCAPTASCRVRAHVASCFCPPGTVGDPFVQCGPRPPPEAVEVEVCQTDADCPSGTACIRETCINPCYELTPCDRTAICSVVDTVPFRTMICSCEYNKGDFTLKSVIEELPYSQNGYKPTFLTVLVI